MQGSSAVLNNSQFRWWRHWCGRARSPTHVPTSHELQWRLNIATVAELAVPEDFNFGEFEFSTISPEPSKHETSFSTFFDALSQADVSILKMEKISRKKVRRERIVVASQNIASKVVRAFVVFHTHARGQIAISCPHLAVFAGFSSLSARNSINGQSVSLIIRS